MFEKARLTRPSVPTILTLAGVALAVAALPASASAAVRTGSVQDPQGDVSALSGPLLDLKSIAVRYDDVEGTLRVTWSYHNDVRAGYDPISRPGGGATVSDAPVVGGQVYDSAMVGWSGSTADDGSWSVDTTLQLTGVNGLVSSTGTISDDGHVATAEFTHSLLVGHDYRQGRIGGAGGDNHDQFWFDGFSDPHPPQLPVGPLGPLPPVGDGGAADDDRSMTINGGAQFTNDPDVTLSVIAPSWANRLRVANDGGFRDAHTFAVKHKIRWHLAESGPERLPKTVYLRFGSDAQNFTDDIILDQTNPMVKSATVDGATAASASTTIAATAAAERPTYRVRVRAKDAISGVAKVQFAHSKRHPSALAKLERINRYKGTRPPKYVRVKDRAGNYSRWRAIR
jgi:hypothetical protein